MHPIAYRCVRTKHVSTLTYSLSLNLVLSFNPLSLSQRALARYRWNFRYDLRPYNLSLSRGLCSRVMPSFIDFFVSTKDRKASLSDLRRIGYVWKDSVCPGSTFNILCCMTALCICLLCMNKIEDFP